MNVMKNKKATEIAFQSAPMIPLLDKSGISTVHSHNHIYNNKVAKKDILSILSQYLSSRIPTDLFLKGEEEARKVEKYMRKLRFGDEQR